MSLLKVFEIHTYRNGAWKIDSMFDDRELALVEADRIDRSNRFAAVRVVEETFDDATEKGGTRTIFRSNKAERINAASQNRQGQSKGAKVAAPPPGRPKRPKKPKRTISRQLLIATFMLTVIAIGGLILLQFLNSLTGVNLR